MRGSRELHDNSTRWYPGCPLDDLTSADLLVVGPKDVIIPSYMPRLSATTSLTQLDAFARFQAAFICTVSYYFLIEQCWAMTSFKDRYQRNRTDLIDDFKFCLGLIKLKLRLFLRTVLVGNDSSTSTLPTEIKLISILKARIFRKALSVYKLFITGQTKQ